MEKIVNFAARQKMTLDDANNIGLYAREAIDNIVGDALVPSAKYAGADVTISGTTKVEVSVPGRLYRAGRVYGLQGENAIEVDLIASLPTAGFKRIVAITLTGSTQNDSVEERDFLTNAETRETQAQPSATRSIRFASVNTVAGTNAVDPVAPATPVEHLVIAYATLTPTGIGSVTQVTSNRLASIVDIDGRLVVVEQWKEITQPIIEGMRSDIAKLQQAANGNQSRASQVYLLEQVARLADRVGVDESASYSKTDWFLDPDESLLTDPQFVAKVQEGFRFADDNSETSSPVLSNPADSKFVVNSDGLLLPAHNHVAIVSNVGKDSEIALSNAGSQTTNYIKRTVAKSRVRWGNTFAVCTNSAMWQTGRYDPITNVFTAFSGETYNVLDPHVAYINHVAIRLQQFWVDNYEEIYWDAITVTASYVGTVAAQTFLVPRAAWLTKVKFGFSRLDTQGDVKVAVCRVTASGAPDPKNALALVTVPLANLKLYPTLTEIAIPPVFAQAGERLAIVLVTAGNHWLAMADNNKYAQGTFFTSTDGAWFQGDISRDACFEVHAAQFAAPRVVIDLDPLSCSGGMSDIDMVLTQIAPDPTKIVFEVKVNNVWYPIAAPEAGANHPLYGLPASVQARMTLIGTTEVMPGIYLGKTKITRSRPRITSTHISTDRNTPAAVTEVQMIATLEHFDAAHNTCAAKLLRGAGFATEISPSSTSDVTLPDGSIRRTFVFTGLAAGLTTYRRKLTIGTDSALRTFHVACLTDVAIP